MNRCNMKRILRFIDRFYFVLSRKLVQRSGVKTEWGSTPKSWIKALWLRLRVHHRSGLYTFFCYAWTSYLDGLLFRMRFLAVISAIFSLVFVWCELVLMKPSINLIAIIFTSVRFATCCSFLAVITCFLEEV